MYIMKRLLAFALVASLLLVPGVVAVGMEVQSTDNDEIQVAYMEFYNNQEYYYNLAREGYTIIILVGEAYADVEKERLEDDSEQTNALLPGTMTRGSTVPTASWNVISLGKYDFSGSATQSSLYTNYKLCGSTSYLITVYNEYDSTSISGVVHGVQESDRTFTVAPLTTMVRVYNTSSKYDYIYLGFYPPVRVSGSVKGDVYTDVEFG